MAKKPSKQEREKQVLFKLISLYVETGKPVGSDTLRSQGFSGISSATIRNDFVRLEKEGFLEQPHSSGGRIPTIKAYRFFADQYKDAPLPAETLFFPDTPNKELLAFVDKAGEILSEKTGCPVFLSLPLFEMDFIQKVRFILLEEKKLLAIVLTDFGLIHTESFYTENAVENDSLSLIEAYFSWRLNKQELPAIADEKLRKTAQRLYNELMVRFIVYSSSTQEKSLIQMGLSKLLAYPEFSEASSLASSLSLFESPSLMQKLLKQAMKKRDILYFIGEDFLEKDCSVIAIPYYINHSVSGALGILGPLRLPYGKLFQLMKSLSKELSERLTETVSTLHISFKTYDDVQKEEHLEACSSILLEDKSQSF